MATFTALCDLGAGIGPMIMGIILQWISYPIMFSCSALTGAINLLYFYHVIGKGKKKADQMMDEGMKTNCLKVFGIFQFSFFKITILGTALFLQQGYTTSFSMSPPHYAKLILPFYHHCASHPSTSTDACYAQLFIHPL